MYAPQMGRFLQRDPVGYPDGPNSYAGYAPMHGGVDPYGLTSTSEIFAAATSELQATSVIDHVGGMWNAIMQGNDTSLGESSGYKYEGRTGLFGAFNRMDVPPTFYKDGILQWTAPTKSPASYLNLAPLLHEMFHAFWDQRIEECCGKVMEYFKSQSRLYGKGLNFSLPQNPHNRIRPAVTDAMRLQVLEEAIATTITQYISSISLPQPPKPNSHGYIDRPSKGGGEVTFDDPAKGGKVLGDNEWKVVRYLMKYSCNEKTDPAKIIGTDEANWGVLSK